MNNFENAAKRHEAGLINPEKLAMLKRVYEAICVEAGIPLDASGRRHELAERLMSVSGIIDEEELLMIFARNTLADRR